MHCGWGLFEGLKMEPGMSSHSSVAAVQALPCGRRLQPACCRCLAVMFCCQILECPFLPRCLKVTLPLLLPEKPRRNVRPVSVEMGRNQAEDSEIAKSQNRKKKMFLLQIPEKSRATKRFQSLIILKPCGGEKHRCLATPSRAGLPTQPPGILHKATLSVWLATQTPCERLAIITRFNPPDTGFDVQ